MKKLLLAALCATAPAFANPTAHPHGSAALPPGPCRGVETIQCHKQNPSRADFTFTLTQCTDKAHGTEATAWRPGLTDKSVPDHTWKKVAEHHDAKRMGAPAEYKAPGFDLSVNWTTAPQADGGHLGHIKAIVSGQQVDEPVVCTLQGGHLEPRHPAPHHAAPHGHGSAAQPE